MAFLRLGWHTIIDRPALLLATVLSLAPLSTAAADKTPDSNARPKVGLALSGGGARGAAHIGVLKVLEQHRIPIDYIAGTSMGAIVGGLYASGMSTTELATQVSWVDWGEGDVIPRRTRSFRRKREDDFYLVKQKPGVSDRSIKFPLGVVQAQNADLRLRRFTLPVATVRDFDDLPIPFRAVATDVVTGEAVVIGSGDLGMAIRASMSVPVVLAPREINGRLLVDGGIRKNLPIDVVRQMGADIVIAVDISTPLGKRDDLISAAAIALQLTGILGHRDTDQQITTLTNKDIFLQPDLGDMTMTSFDRADDAIQIGAATAEAALDKLGRLSMPEQDYRDHVARRPGRPAQPIIDEVKIVNQSRVADALIASRLRVEKGSPLDVVQLESDLTKIRGLELFEFVYYDILNESNRTTLTVTVRERSWGPNYLQFGITVAGDFKGNNKLNFSVAYDRTAINRLNGEWRTGFQVGQEPGAFTEIYQPLAYSNPFFTQATAWLGSESVIVYDTDGNRLTESRMVRYGIELAIGRELGVWAEVRAGIARATGEVRIRVGDHDTPDFAFETSEVFVQFYADELDDVSFPRSGGSLRVRAAAGLSDIGSSNDYEQGTVEGRYAQTLGGLVGVVSGSLSATNDDDAPFQSRFLLGGFTRLSGLSQDELEGQHAALLTATFYRQIAGTGAGPLYAGLSLEYGRVSQDVVTLNDAIAATSVFLGIDTFIGPAYIAYGRAEGDRANVYFFLGQPSRKSRRVGFRN